MSGVSVVVPLRAGDPHRDAIWEWVEKWWATWFPDFEVVTADSTGERFNRGEARNRAIRNARGVVLIIADADTIPHPPAVTEAVARVSEGRAGWALPYGKDRYYNLTEGFTRRRLMFPPDTAAPIEEPWDSDDWEHRLTSWAGCLIVRRVDAVTAGGYPEFPEWGWEDDAFRAAMDFVAGNHQRIPGFCLHLWHPASETDRFGNPDIESNRAVFLEYSRARSHSEMRAVIDKYGGLAIR